jgi:hypothetical protein
MTVLTNFRIDEETRKRFHIYCIQNNTNIAERLRSYIFTDLEDGSFRQKPIRPKENKNIETQSGWRDTLLQEPRWENSY